MHAPAKQAYEVMSSTTGSYEGTVVRWSDVCTKMTSGKCNSNSLLDIWGSHLVYMHCQRGTFTLRWPPVPAATLTAPCASATLATTIITPPGNNRTKINAIKDDAEVLAKINLNIDGGNGFLVEGFPLRASSTMGSVSVMPLTQRCMWLGAGAAGMARVSVR